MWNPTAFTDAAGALTHTATRDAWGAGGTVTVVDPTAPAPTVGHSSMPVAAAAATGLVHLRARDYDPATGAFLSPDPWVRPAGQPWVGVHAYTDGNPVQFWDPSGLRARKMLRNAWGLYTTGLSYADDAVRFSLTPTGYIADLRAKEILDGSFIENEIARTQRTATALGVALGCAAGATVGAFYGGAAGALWFGVGAVPAGIAGGVVGCGVGGTYAYFGPPVGAPGPEGF